MRSLKELPGFNFAPPTDLTSGGHSFPVAEIKIPELAIKPNLKADDVRKSLHSIFPTLPNYVLISLKDKRRKTFYLEPMSSGLPLRYKNGIKFYEYWDGKPKAQGFSPVTWTLQYDNDDVASSEWVNEDVGVKLGNVLSTILDYYRIPEESKPMLIIPRKGIVLNGPTQSLVMEVIKGEIIHGNVYLTQTPISTTGPSR